MKSFLKIERKWDNDGAFGALMTDLSNAFECLHHEILTCFMPLVSFYTPLKTSENQTFSDVFRGYRKRPVA